MAWVFLGIWYRLEVLHHTFEIEYLSEDVLVSLIFTKAASN